MASSSRKLLTLVLVMRDGHILLGKKKRGFGVGKMNGEFPRAARVPRRRRSDVLSPGFGGKLEAGETIEQAARRELHEEAGIEAQELHQIGLLHFDFKSESFSRPLEVHVFKCTQFSGQPRESEEMTVSWRPVDAIPFDRMWPDDRIWFPYLLSGRPFLGHFVMGTDDMLAHALTETPGFDGDFAAAMPRAVVSATAT